MKIEFTINNNELKDLLQFTAPFIRAQRKNEDKRYEETIEITLPEPYFYDKVTFLLHKTYACLFVLTKEGVRIERTCSIESNCDDISFCLPHAYLWQEVNKTDSAHLKFIEDRFFGFIVSDEATNVHLFDIDAYSARNQGSIFPIAQNTHYPHTFDIEHDILLSILREFGKYTSKYTLRPYSESIWVFIKNGHCKVLAGTDVIVRQEIFQTKAEGTYSFTIKGEYAARLLDIITKWSDKNCHQISYNDKYLCLYNYCAGSNYAETIELPLNQSELPNFSKVFEKRNITNYSSLKVCDLRSTFRIMNTISYKDEYVVMHFFRDHVNLYCQDDEEKRKVYEFHDTIETDSEFVIRLNQKLFESILEEIHTENVLLMLTNNYMLYVYNENEPLFDSIIRIICIAQMQDKDKVLLECGDKALNSHSNYMRKYLSE